MNIIIVEDQSLLRETLKLYLEKEEGFKIVGSAANGQQAILMSNKLKPDFILMDIKMPIMSGLEATKIIKAENPNIKILILTLYENDMELVDSILAEADGYLLKDIEPEILISSIKLINMGVSVYKKNILKSALSSRLPQKDIEHDIDLSFNETELEIIQKLCEGKQNKIIADELSCSVGTVKNKIAGILSKTNLTDRTQIVIYAIKHGLLA